MIKADNRPTGSSIRALGRRGVFIALLMLVAGLSVPPALAQRSADRGTGGKMSDAENRAVEALGAPSDEDAVEAAAGAAATPPQEEARSINVLQLATDGGVLMIPIMLMSVIVVAFAVERFLGLRRIKVIPTELVDGLGELSQQKGGLDPRKAYQLCQQYPSTAATVVRAVLLKMGRPHSEVEHAVAESSEREAGRLYKNVRPLELAVTVTPLIGLLGTVQGMIMAFFVTASATSSLDKAEQLAAGIYVALVTTFAGLSVAIPAAILAHHFEGRIQNLFRDIDELLLGLLPQWERYEGKLRVSRESLSAPVEEPPRQPPEKRIKPPPAPAPK